MARYYRKMGQYEAPWPGATPLVTNTPMVTSAPATPAASSSSDDFWTSIIRGGTQLGVEITRAAGGYYNQPTATTYQPGMMPSGYGPMPSGVGGISSNTLLLLGGGALVLFLLMGKKASA